MNEYPEFVVRMIDEESELNCKIKKLECALEKFKQGLIQLKSPNLLEAQLSAMKAYEYILNIRIKEFTTED